MQRLEVSSAVRHIYVIRRLKVKAKWWAGVDWRYQTQIKTYFGLS
jgi:hypothetical protein